MLASPPTRVNGNGVDLNRNFPTPDWVRDAHDYWAGRTKSDPRRFPGKEANSEIETKWLNEVTGDGQKVNGEEHRAQAATRVEELVIEIQGYAQKLGEATQAEIGRAHV